MKCTQARCPGVYELRTVVHTVKQRGQVLVIDHVSGQVCNVCGDVQFTPEPVRRIEALLKATPPPTRKATSKEYWPNYDKYFPGGVRETVFPFIPRVGGEDLKQFLSRG